MTSAATTVPPPVPGTRPTRPGAGPAALARPRRRPHGYAGAVAVATAAALLVAGCDLRLETPPPATPSPDATELVRDAVATDAAAIATLATQAAEREPVEVAGVLLQVAEASRLHLDALGGVYEMYPASASPTAPDGPTSAPSPGEDGTPAPTPPPPADAAAVLTRLEAGATAARIDASEVVDGDLARLLASVAVSRLLLAETLARATGVEVAAPELLVPTELPEGLTADDAAVVVLAEDAAGMVWEVAAARSAEPVRGTAALRARTHRERAQGWAAAAGLAGTPQDPRRSSYDLPDDLTSADATQDTVLAVGARVEAELVVTYATLVAGVAAGSRAEVVDAVAEYARQAVVAGAPVPAFPGLPERA